MPDNKGEIEVTGRVNGMGEMDPEGSYAEFIIRTAEEAWTLSISEQQAIDIAANIGRAWPEVHREEGEYISYADVVRLLRDTCDREGGQIDFARKHDLSPAYVSDVVRERRDPGQGILAALGLVKVVLYAREGGGSDG